MNVTSIGNIDPSVSGTLRQSGPVSMAQVWNTLGTLRTQDPTAFTNFATNAASELQAAAQNQPAGKTQDFLNGFAQILQNAASDPNAPLSFPANHGQYAPRQHPVAESFLRSINLQAQALLNTPQA